MSDANSTFAGVAHSTGYISVANASGLIPYDNQTVAMQSFENTPLNPPGTVNATNPAYPGGATGRIFGAKA